MAEPKTASPSHMILAPYSFSSVELFLELSLVSFHKLLTPSCLPERSHYSSISSNAIAPDFSNHHVHHPLFLTITTTLFGR